MPLSSPARSVFGATQALALVLVVGLVACGTDDEVSQIRVHDGGPTVSDGAGVDRDGGTSDASRDGSMSDASREGSMSDVSRDGSTSDVSRDGSTSDVSRDGSTSDVSRDGSTSDVSRDVAASDGSREGGPNDGSSPEADGPCHEYPESGSCVPCPTPHVECRSIEMTSPSVTLYDPTTHTISIEISAGSRVAAPVSASVAFRACALSVTVAVEDATVDGRTIAVMVPSGLSAVVLDCLELDYTVQDRCGQTSSFRALFTAAGLPKPQLSCP